MCHSLKKVDSQNQKTNANQTFTQTGALSWESDGSILQGRYMRNPYLQDSAHISRH